MLDLPKCKFLVLFLREPSFGPTKVLFRPAGKTRNRETLQSPEPHRVLKSGPGFKVRDCVPFHARECDTRPISPAQRLPTLFRRESKTLSALCRSICDR